MATSQATSANQPTIFVEGNKPVFPCRCGQTHRGDYACEDMMKHECLHNCALIRLTADVGYCPLCGTSWLVKGESMAEGGMVAVDYGLP